MEIIDEIINFIRSNGLSSAQVGDAIGKVGGVNCSPILTNKTFVGKLFYTYSYADSNWFIHNDIIEVEENMIVFIEDLGETNKALFGEIVSKFILNNKKAQAIVTNGKIRDLFDIKKDNLAIWHNFSSSIGCYNSKPIYTDDLEKIAQERKRILSNSIIICDDDGAVIIPKDLINQELKIKLIKIKKQEEIWKECVFLKKWNTYDTICMKKYLGK